MIPVEISSQQRQQYRAQDGVLICWHWAVREFGNPGLRWQWNTDRVFFFRDSADAVFFKLKWT
jgi:hypothetical protein